MAFDTALTSFARDDGTIRVTTLPASSLRAPSRRKRPSQLTQASTATSSARTTRGKSRGGDATMDHLQCSFCKLYGHGREGQGALMFACRIRGERQFAHEYCLFLAPKARFPRYSCPCLRRESACLRDRVLVCAGVFQPPHRQVGQRGEHHALKAVPSHGASQGGQGSLVPRHQTNRPMRRRLARSVSTVERPSGAQ